MKSVLSQKKCEESCVLTDSKESNENSNKVSGKNAVI